MLCNAQCNVLTRYASAWYQSSSAREHSWHDLFSPLPAERTDAYVSQLTQQKGVHKLEPLQEHEKLDIS